MKERRDLEKGGAKASILKEDCSHAVPAVPFSRAEDAREIEPDDHGLVLPCAPSDEEKVRGEVRGSRTNSQTAALGTCPFFLSTSIRTFGRFLVFVTFNTRRLLYMPPSCVRHVVCTAKNEKKKTLIAFLHRSGLYLTSRLALLAEVGSVALTSLYVNVWLFTLASRYLFFTGLLCRRYSPSFTSFGMSSTVASQWFQDI